MEGGRYIRKDQLDKRMLFLCEQHILSARRMEVALKIFDNVTVKQETLLILSCPFASGWPTMADGSNRHC